MGTFSPAIGHPVRTAALIGAEDEAISVAASIAVSFEPAGPDGTVDSQEARLEMVGRSGLFGVSVPTEHGGIDVSNTVLAEICALACERSAALGEVLAAHFVALEHLRSHGTEGQQTALFPAALAGARLSMAMPVQRDGGTATALPLTPAGVGWRMGGELLCTPCARHADWVLVPTRSETGKTALALLPTRIDGLHYVANTCEPTAQGTARPEHVLVKDVPVDAGALLHAVADVPRSDVPHALDLLLQAARHLGAGRRSLQAALSDDDADPLAIGLASARIAAAGAAVEQAGRAIDAAQIGLAELHRTNAFLAAADAFVTAADAAGRAAAPARPDAPPAKAPDDLAATIADILRETGALRLMAHRLPPEED